MAGSGASWGEQLATWAWGGLACMSDLSGACAVEWGEAETAESDVWQWGSEGSNGAGWASRRGLRLVDGASC